MIEKYAKRRLLTVENRQRYLFFNNKQYLNLSSNDYLALTDIDLQEEFIKGCNFSSKFLLSNPSSRLMSGNSPEYTKLEKTIATLFRKESALVLSCGFMANSGVLGALCTKKDLIIADKLIHASLIDGIKGSGCDFLRFKHNNIAHLKALLNQHRTKYNRVVVATESIFSMDGDIAPLKDIVELKKEYDLTLYLDEAHAFGVRGENGCGVAEEQGLLSHIDIIVVTLGKAIASQGGVVISTHQIREELINKMRTLIFSTAIPDLSLMWSNFIIERLPLMGKRRENLAQISAELRRGLNSTISSSHIVPYIVASNEKAVKLQEELAQQGYWVSAIRHPTVPLGSERVRISLNSSITLEEVTQFCNTLLQSSFQQ